MMYLAPPIETYLADSDGFLGDFGIANVYLVRLNGRRIDRIGNLWDKDNTFNPARSRASDPGALR